MTGVIEVIDSGILSADAIMDKDAALLNQMNKSSSPLLHLYEWKNTCFTYGYFTDPARYLHLDKVHDLGIDLARRPTGGGIIFHLSDFAFSILIPEHHPRFSLNPLENYAWINSCIAAMIVQFAKENVVPYLLSQDVPLSNLESRAFCMAHPTRYDLFIQGKKVGGAAQRRTKAGLLHQATLSLCFPPFEILSQIMKYHDTIERMKDHTYCLLSERTTMEDVLAARHQLRTLIKNLNLSL